MLKKQTQRGWPEGMNNVLAEYEIPPKQVRRIVNADVLDSGKIRRRKGITQVSASPAHSLWSNGATALFCSADVLYRLESDETETPLVTGLAGRPVSYVEAGSDIHWANGAQNGIITDSVNRAWGVEMPPSPPVLSSVAGSLATGTYQAVCTFITATGEESGAGRSSSLSVTAGGLTATLPQPTSAEVTHVRLYLTPTNGDLFYLAATVAVGVTTYSVTVTPDQGQALRTQFMSKFLPCDLLEHYRGRIYGATGPILWHTEPFNYGLYRPAKNFMVFPSEIRLLAAVTSGMFVVCDRTYWLEGPNPEDFIQREVLPYGAARRSVSRLPDSRGVVWFGDRGLVSGGESGAVTELQAKNVMPGAYANGATLVREQDSLRQVISVVRDPTELSGLVATDFMDAEIIRGA